jgi:hypothetical protein
MISSTFKWKLILSLVFFEKRRHSAQQAVLMTVGEKNQIITSFIQKGRRIREREEKAATSM